MVHKNLPLQESHQSVDPNETVEEVPPSEKKQTSDKATTGKRSRLNKPVKKFNIKLKPKVPTPVVVNEEEERKMPTEGKEEEEKVRLSTEEDTNAKKSKDTSVPEEAIAAEEASAAEETIAAEGPVAAEEAIAAEETIAVEENVEKGNDEEIKQHNLNVEDVAEERTKSPPPSQEEQSYSPPSA